MSVLLPTEFDGEWVAYAMDGVLPEFFDSREWIQEPHFAEIEGTEAQKFTSRGQNLTVLCSISIAHDKGKRYATYRLIIFKIGEGKVKAPNQADVARVFKSFIKRELKPGELVHNGKIGANKAHHIICKFPEPTILL